MKAISIKTLSLAAAVFCLGACADPLSSYYTELQRYGYIPYSTPMEFAGTGTLIGGSPLAMEIVANPRSCFANIDTGNDAVRFRDNTSLPTTTASFAVSNNLQVSLFKLLGVGSATIEAGAQISEVATIDLSFEGVHIEYLDSVRLVNYYRTQMSDICREYLDRVGLIIQAVAVDKMRFAFTSKNGGRILITLNNIQQYLNIHEDVQWEIDQTATLIINTPKYIGYQLAEMREADKGLSLRRASRVVLNKWIFEDVAIFPND